jgi:hypothetical protein
LAVLVVFAAEAQLVRETILSVGSEQEVSVWKLVAAGAALEE